MVERETMRERDRERCHMSNSKEEWRGRGGSEREGGKPMRERQRETTRESEMQHETVTKEE